METIFNGIAGKLHIGEPELYIDNEARRRSGHMTHAMVEYEPGKIIDFNSNCSPIRCGGHSAFGWVEYRYSEDYGRTWSESHDLPYSREEFFDGNYTISVEKAVICGGIITAFALRNTQFNAICCEPWASQMVVQSHDFGKTWSKPFEFSPWEGRIYDAVVRDGVIYVLQLCNPEHVATKPEHLYRLFASSDCGKSFHLESIVDIETIGHAYGALQFRPDGSLVAYANDIWNGYLLAESVSDDLGRSWRRLPSVRLKEGIRNIQVSRLGDGYVIHGRAFRDSKFGKGQAIYTSKDGLNWDDGILLEPEKVCCYYSNMLPLKHPDGKEELLLQYSDSVLDDPDTANETNWGHVNVMHRFLHFE